MTGSRADTRWRTLLSLALVAGLLIGAVGAGAAARTEQRPTGPTFAVALQEDGSARVTLTTTFDLASDGERQAFRELRDNETALAEVRTTFADRLSRIADRTANRTGREMSVTDPAVSVREADGTGYVDLSVTWTGLARVEDSRLTVTAPFAGGFRPPQAFAVSAPDGHELATVRPTPDNATAATARWAAGTDIENFRVVATPAADADASGGSTPGFGPLAALLAIAALRLRRRDRG